mgnify:CR=1 FL=1
MKKCIMVGYEEEKLLALRMYAEQRGVSVEEELAQAAEAMYQKVVPANVRAFVDMKVESQKGTIEFRIPELCQEKPIRQCRRNWPDAVRGGVHQGKTRLRAAPVILANMPYPRECSAGNAVQDISVVPGTERTESKPCGDVSVEWSTVLAIVASHLQCMRNLCSRRLWRQSIP